MTCPNGAGEPCGVVVSFFAPKLKPPKPPAAGAGAAGVLGAAPNPPVVGVEGAPPKPNAAGVFAAGVLGVGVLVAPPPPKPNADFGASAGLAASPLDDAPKPNPLFGAAAVAEGAPNENDGFGASPPAGVAAAAGAPKDDDCAPFAAALKPPKADLGVSPAAGAAAGAAPNPPKADFGASAGFPNADVDAAPFVLPNGPLVWGCSAGFPKALDAGDGAFPNALAPLVGWPNSDGAAGAVPSFFSALFDPNPKENPDAGFVSAGLFSAALFPKPNDSVLAGAEAGAAGAGAADGFPKLKPEPDGAADAGPPAFAPKPKFDCPAGGAAPAFSSGFAASAGLPKLNPLADLGASAGLLPKLKDDAGLGGSAVFGASADFGTSVGLPKLNDIAGFGAAAGAGTAGFGKLNGGGLVGGADAGAAAAAGVVEAAGAVGCENRLSFGASGFAALAGFGFAGLGKLNMDLGASAGFGASVGFAGSAVAGFEKKLGTVLAEAGLSAGAAGFAAGVEAVGAVKPNFNGEPAAGTVAGIPSRLEAGFGASAGLAGRPASGEDTVIAGTGGLFLSSSWRSNSWRRLLASASSSCFSYQLRGRLRTRLSGRVCLPGNTEPILLLVRPREGESRFDSSVPPFDSMSKLSLEALRRGVLFFVKLGSCHSNGLPFSKRLALPLLGESGAT